MTTERERSKWNDGWWADHKKAKKSALPTIHNVRKKAKKKKGKRP